MDALGGLSAGSRNLALINNASPAVGGRIRRRIWTLILRQSTQHLINAAARNGVAGAAREDAVQSDVGTAGQTFRRALRRERARCPRWCAVIIGRVDAATQNALSARFIRDGADLNKCGGEKQCRNQCTPTCAPGGGAMQRFRPRAAYSHLVPPRDRRRQCRHQLVSPIPKFALSRGTLCSELRNQRDTSKYMIVVWLWI